MRLDPQQTIRNYLSAYYFKTASRNPRFSLRAFASKLGISSAALSEIMRGKRNVSRAKARQFAHAIKLGEKDLKMIEDVFSTVHCLETLKERTNPLKEVLIGPPQFEVMADWLHFALVALMRTEGFQPDPYWIAKRLGVSKEKVLGAIEALKASGSLIVHEDGRLEDVRVCYRTTEEFPQAMIDRRMIDGLKKAIEIIPIESTNHFGAFSTISADVSKIPAARAYAEDFVKRLSLFLAEGRKTEVLELNIQLFPLSRPT